MTGATSDGSRTAVPRRPTGIRARRMLASENVARTALPVVAAGLIVGLWWLGTVALAVPDYLVPGPQVVLSTVVELWPYLLQHSGVTLAESVFGFGLSIAVGVPVALLIARSKTLEQMLYPLLVAVNAIPKVAIAPILVVWMGFGQAPKVVMAALLCMFPIVLATVAGLRSTPSELVELSRSLDAGEAQEFARVRLRWALPQIFTGLKTAITLAVIGAVIGEFVGSSSGLGYVIIQSGASADTALAFAAIALLSVMSIALFYGLVWLDRTLLPWAEENR